MFRALRAAVAVLALATAKQGASRETRQDRIESVVAGLTDCIESPGREARKLQDADRPSKPSSGWRTAGAEGGGGVRDEPRGARSPDCRWFPLIEIGGNAGSC